MISKINEIVGTEVTNVIAGGANGSIFILEMNNRYLLTVYCAWRLELAHQVLTGCNESSDSLKGDIPSELKKLSHDKVKAVFLSNFYDLKVEFISTKVLNVFCDVTPHSEPEDYDENWVICDQQEDKCYVINSHFQIVTSKYRSETEQ